MHNFYQKNINLWRGFCGLLRERDKVIHQILRYNITSTEVSAALRPFYFLVHPDLFGQHPRAQHVNDSSLKSLNNHIDHLLKNRKINPVQLQFYVKNKKNKGRLKSLSINLDKNSAKATIHNILSVFDLPTKYVEGLPERSNQPDRPIKWHQSYYNATGRIDPHQEFYTSTRENTLYSWLIKNTGKAEKRQTGSEPIRQDILRIKSEIEAKVNLEALSWQRGLGTTHLRGCMQGLHSLLHQHPDIIHILKGRQIHFANETGMSSQGCIVLSTSEVRDQWLQMIKTIPQEEIRIKKVPDMQKALSNSLRDIQITHRMYQPFLVIGNYSDNLKRLVTALGDYKGRNGFPRSWPPSLSHLQLVVESAAGPLMLSPSGQVIAPSTCPPSLLINFITENMTEANQRLLDHQRIHLREETLHNLAREELGLEFLEKDDAVLPEDMIQCLERLLEHSYRFSPLLTGARMWITQYYSVMLDGELCIPWNWK